MSPSRHTLATRRIASSGERPGLALLVISEGRTTSHPLPEVGERVLGRSSECDIRIDDSTLSRRHAKLHIGAQLSIEDLGTMNGTKVRDARIEPGTLIQISLGELVDLGSVMIVVQRAHVSAVGDPPSAAAPVSDAVTNLHRLADRIAPGMINVLIHGETGSGKEVLAARIHQHSARAKKPYVRLNCAALSDTLLESELFGHERGAFTGAAQAKPGLLETADGGTVLLDEIGELPMSLQVKLLRVIEQREVLRVGGLAPRSIDVRFIAATNRDLEAEAAQGRFREDLYFRLAGITLVVPPLRARQAEIPALVRSLATETSHRIGRVAPSFSAEALALLVSYRWPGNVRELRNIVERAALLAGDGPVLPEHLPLEKLGAATPSQRTAAPIASDPAVPPDLRSSMEDAERQHIVDALQRSGGSQTKAAQLLGISRRTLTNRLNALKLPRPRKT